jgi:hypothetical protein
MKPFANAASILPFRIPTPRTQAPSRPTANLAAHPHSHRSETAPVAPLHLPVGRTHPASRPAPAIHQSNPRPKPGTQVPQ